MHTTPRRGQSVQAHRLSRVLLGCSYSWPLQKLEGTAGAAASSSSPGPQHLYSSTPSSSSAAPLHLQYPSTPAALLPLALISSPSSFTPPAWTPNTTCVVMSPNPSLYLRLHWQCHLMLLLCDVPTWIVLAHCSAMMSRWYLSSLSSL